MEIRCVYKTGGDYNSDYVRYLMDAVQRNISTSIDFVCLTDADNIDFCETIPLKHNWPGWWSKIELFRDDLPNESALYFDLDTVITGNIDYMLDIASRVEFIVLRGFNYRVSRMPGMDQNFASGIMAGKFYKYSNIYHKFKDDPEMYMNRKDRMHGDQGFIASCLDVNNIPRLQSSLPEKYIVGKKFIQKNDYIIPKNTSIVAWSGSPRLHELDNNIYRKWIGQ